MKTNNMIAGLACVLSLSALFGASESSAGKTLCETASGVFSVQGSFDPNEYDVSYQVWNDKNYYKGGTIVVLAKGGMAKPASKALAAQFPAMLRQYYNSKYRDVLTRLIDNLNISFTSNLSQLGFSDPNITALAVLLEIKDTPGLVSSGSHAICFGRGKNRDGQACIIPGLDEFEQKEIGGATITQALSDEADAPILCWEPKPKE